MAAAPFVAASSCGMREMRWHSLIAVTQTVAMQHVLSLCVWK